MIVLTSIFNFPYVHTIVLYCAYTVGSSVTYKIARSRATLLSNYPVRIQMILRDREIIRMKSVHSRFREHMARKIRKHALPGDIACCHGPGIKALNCCALCAVLGWSFGRLHKYLHIVLCALSYRANRTVNKSSVESCHVQNDHHLS